ncbi:type III secretion system translocon subunit SctE [Pantoea sp. LMR881]|uniref:type III secretion system translocon subunit SctE n=1 Tax=Pantoea sp. LMR881 TaxID=3014336 RepID=UPI0022AFA3AD|nr:type III secretion system translocon subunit SctE [Pantoea sp. LMR881]MCZ4057969.1 type III secretion system translocon subunit SctE [Pantoea sp. LMR881]
MSLEGISSFNKNASLEKASHSELKKHSDQARRFGNKQYKEHVLGGQVEKALQVLQPEQLQTILKNASNTLKNSGSVVNGFEREFTPKLSPDPIQLHPAVAEAEMASSATDKTLNASARLTGILAAMSKLMTESSVQNLINQLSAYNSLMKGSSEASATLTTQLEKQGLTWTADSDHLKHIQKQADKLSADKASAGHEFESAKTTLASLQSQAAMQNANFGSVSPELQAEIAAAQLNVNVASAKYEATRVAYTSFVKSTLTPAIETEKTSKNALQTTQQEAVKLVGSLSTQQITVIEVQRIQKDAQSKSLTYLMAVMAQLINEAANEDLEVNAALKQKLAEASAKDAEKKAKEYDDQMRKAEETQKTMGCIGKVLGWVITAVSFAAAIFTGGASLALAAVALSLMLADEVGKAVTGKSFMQAALQPIMDSIVKPLMELIGNMLTRLLEQMGVDASTAAMVGQILGAIAAAVILIASVYVAGSAASKLASKAMSNIGTHFASQLSRIATSTTGQVFKRISNGLGRNLGMNEAKMATVVTRTQMGLAGGTMANTTLQVAGGISVAALMTKAETARAQMMRDAALQQILSDMMDRVVNNFSQRLGVANSIISDMSAAAEDSFQAGKYISHQLSSITA